MSDLAISMQIALMNGGTFPPPGVPDTLANRQLWDKIAADLDQLAREGIQPDIPADYNHEPAGG